MKPSPSPAPAAPPDGPRTTADLREVLDALARAVPSAVSVEHVGGAHTLWDGPRLHATIRHNPHPTQRYADLDACLGWAFAEAERRGCPLALVPWQGPRGLEWLCLPPRGALTMNAARLSIRGDVRGIKPHASRTIAALRAVLALSGAR